MPYFDPAGLDAFGFGNFVGKARWVVFFIGGGIQAGPFIHQWLEIAVVIDPVADGIK